MLQQLECHKLLIGVMLRDTELWLPSLAWPKLVALVSPILSRLTSAYDHRHILLKDHLPEMICSLWKWALTRDNFFVCHCGIIDFLKWRVDVASINVI